MADAVIAHLDEVQGKHDSGLEWEECNKAHHQFPDNVEVLWRLVRAYYDRAADTSDKKQKEEDFKVGLELAKRALQIGPENFGAHKWYAVMLSKVGDYLPTKEKIASAFEIREHFEKAHQISPEDATTLHCLGRWCYSVASIGWMEKKLASVLFATPPESSYEEAEKYFLAAYEKQPNYLNNLAAIGDLYIDMKKKDEAKKYLELLANQTPISLTEKELQDSGAQKLKKL